MQTEVIRPLNAAGMIFQTSQFGNDPGTLLIHGFGSDLHTWDSLCEALHEQKPNPLHYLRYDLRGFGESKDVKSESFSHTEDLHAILDNLAIPQCNLVGTSMGGAIALNFALNHPRRVRKLILISPALTAWEWSASWSALWKDITTKARNGDLDEARRLWWQHPLFDTTRQSPAAESLYHSIMGFSGDQWIVDRQQAAMGDIERLHSLSVETLLLSGRKDLEDFRLISDIIEASSDRVKRIDFPELGHLLYLEDPTACANQINAFVGEDRN